MTEGGLDDEGGFNTSEKLTTGTRLVDNFEGDFDEFDEDEIRLKDGFFTGEGEEILGLFFAGSDGSNHPSSPLRFFPAVFDDPCRCGTVEMQNPGYTTSEAACKLKICSLLKHTPSRST